MFSLDTADRDSLSFIGAVSKDQDLVVGIKNSKYFQYIKITDADILKIFKSVAEFELVMQTLGY
jgi:hypothetical protein